MIRGYPRHASVRPGETLTLHVSTTAPAFRVEWRRHGARLEPVAGAAADARPGRALPEGPPDRDWGWPAHEFAVPDEWRSGAYVALLVELDTDGRDTTAAAGEVLFVVRPPLACPTARILYKLSWATYHAYNSTGYGSLDAEALWSKESPRPGFKVTFRRPGGGAGGVVQPGDPPDAHEPSSRRQTFAHWDAPLVAWLEESGFAVDYCTDLDLHQDIGLLDPYALLLSVGHDEYWSEAMRANLDAFTRGGGNIAFLSGNIGGYRVHLTDGDTAMVCAKVVPPSKEASAWERDEPREFDPENRTTGVSIHNAGGWWDGRREALGYTVQHAAHWVYDETGLADGDIFGDDAELPLLGYECDGAEFDRRADGLAVATGGQGTPDTFFILGLAELGPGWSRYKPGAAATMGIFTTPRGGIVFQGATTDWPMLVPRNAHVARITHNVLERLQLRSVPVLGPLPTRGGRMLAAQGETVALHADTAHLGREGLTCEWEVAGAAIVAADGPAVGLAVGATGAPVSAWVTVSDAAGTAIGFGTHTFLPLTPRESLALEVTTLLREMVMPSEPSSPLVVPSDDPFDRIGDVIAVRLPWLNERARRLERVTAELMALDRAAEHAAGDVPTMEGGDA
ncbi:MAG: hypothetical protein QOD65_2283 [Gaiellales bacterium]|nr:hypothetical protein [Gaiellales bacterium]